MAAKKNSHNEEKDQGQAHLGCSFCFSTPATKIYSMKFELGYIFYLSPFNGFVCALLRAAFRPCQKQSVVRNNKKMQIMTVPLSIGI